MLRGAGVYMRTLSAPDTQYTREVPIALQHYGLLNAAATVLSAAALQSIV